MLKFSGVFVLAFVILSIPYLNFAQDVTVKESVVVNQDLIKMHLYTQASDTDLPDWTFYLNETDLSENVINTTESVVMIFHGFHGGFNDTLLQLVKNAIMRKTGWNVIIVDWAPLSKVTHYKEAVNNAHSISLLLGQWLSDVVSKGFVSPDRIQLVGFSIGAHMAGIVAKRVQERGKIAKIFGCVVYGTESNSIRVKYEAQVNYRSIRFMIDTYVKLSSHCRVVVHYIIKCSQRSLALDPAFPIYETKPESERLHKDDANFVEVIHTCGHHISYETSLGHVDFYPNGGTFPQSDCIALKPDVWGLDIITVMICSHTIVLRYFSESVVDENKFVATKCDSWIEFQKSNCSAEQTPMGFATPTNVSGDYYLDVHLRLSRSDILSSISMGHVGGSRAFS